MTMSASRVLCAGANVKCRSGQIQCAAKNVTGLATLPVVGPMDDPPDELTSRERALLAAISRLLVLCRDA